MLEYIFLPYNKGSFFFNKAFKIYIILISFYSLFPVFWDLYTSIKLYPITVSSIPKLKIYSFIEYYKKL